MIRVGRDPHRRSSRPEERGRPLTEHGEAAEEHDPQHDERDGQTLPNRDPLGAVLSRVEGVVRIRGVPATVRSAAANP
jgi:hypothetical protein